jgi:hypothetical protein
MLNNVTSFKYDNQKENVNEKVVNILFSPPAATTNTNSIQEAIY